MMALLVCSFSAWSSGSDETTGADGRHHVVFYLNSGDETIQKGALNNVKHLYQERGGDRIKVELAVHGAGLEMLTKRNTQFAEELERFEGLYGVSSTACSNTMKAMNLTRDDLMLQLDRTVPAMVRLMEPQEADWVYIKP